MVSVWLRRVGGAIAGSFVCARGRRLWARNVQDWFLPLSKLDKAQVGIYLVLSDYATGIFPPRFDDQKSAYANEIAYDYAIPGLSLEEFNRREMRKPFWGARQSCRYLTHYLRILEALERLTPAGARVLDLGCGTGWISELLAIEGYDVTGASLAPFEIALAQRRVEALVRKGIPLNLQFVVSAMEDLCGVPGTFQFVFVYEALHHAFDWPRTFQSVYDALDPGGWFYICSEPNVSHTVVAYRGTKHLKTHEIGLSRRALTRALRKTGFVDVHSTHHRLNNFVSTHWILARRPAIDARRSG